MRFVSFGVIARGMVEPRRACTCSPSALPRTGGFEVMLGFTPGPGTGGARRCGRCAGREHLRLHRAARKSSTPYRRPRAGRRAREPAGRRRLSAQPSRTISCPSCRGVDAFVGRATRASPTRSQIRRRMSPSSSRGAADARCLSPRVRTGAWWTAYLKVSRAVTTLQLPSSNPRAAREPALTKRPVGRRAWSATARSTPTIAQDLTAYGATWPTAACPTLLRALAMRVRRARSPAVRHPSSVTDDLLEVIARRADRLQSRHAAPAHRRRHAAGDAASAAGRPSAASSDGFAPRFPGSRHALLHRKIPRRDRGARGRAVRLPG
jgi:hypothetical protein